MTTPRDGRSTDSSTRRRPWRSAQLAFGIVPLLALAVVCSTAATSVAASTSHESHAAVPVGSSTHTITVGTLARTFLVYRPASLSRSSPVPLVVMIHGGGGNAAAAERTYGWDAEADSEHFVVAYPEGIDHSWSVGGGCCGVPARSHINDAGFITQLVSTVSRELPIDPKRVYATGISEGGMLAYHLACQTSVFAAIGPDSATLLGSCPAPPAISVIHIHGTADQRIPYDGSPGAGVNHIDGPSIPDLNAMWRSVDRCPLPRTTAAGLVTTSVATCPHGRSVVLISVAGAGHQWPGAVCGSRCSRGLADPPSTALNATQTIWRFFAQHHR